MLPLARSELSGGGVMGDARGKHQGFWGSSVFEAGKVVTRPVPSIGDDP